MSVGVVWDIDSGVIWLEITIQHHEILFHKLVASRYTISYNWLRNIPISDVHGYKFVVRMMCKAWKNVILTVNVYSKVVLTLFHTQRFKN
jgi:hypothetical protein